MSLHPPRRDEAWKKRVGFDNIKSEDELAKENLARKKQEEQREVDSFLKSLGRSRN